MTNLFKVEGQTLTPIEIYPAVSDTVNYLTFLFTFSFDWDGLTKSAIFTKGDDVYEVVLTNDEVLESDHVNLSAGVWSISVVGDTVVDAVVTRQITTSSYDYTVAQSGATSGGVFPPSVASQVYVNVNQATPQTFVGGIPKLAADRVIDHDNELADKKYVDDKVDTVTADDFNHNDLSNKQGGTAGEYYHTTQAQNAELHAHSNKTALDAVSGTNTGDQDAAGVANTPAGNIAATTVQAAINELDAAIAPVTSQLAEIASDVRRIDTALETDKTLTVSGMAADAKVTGDKVGELKSDLDKIINGKPNSYILEWVDGGINASSGVNNSNNFAIRTDKFYKFSDADITISDATKNMIWRLYWIAYSDAAASAFVESGSFSNASLPQKMQNNKDYFYRFMYYDTSNVSRPTYDTLQITGDNFELTYCPEIVKEEIEQSTDSLKDELKGTNKIVPLANLVWTAGRINSSGVNYNGPGYAYRTSGYYMFEAETITIRDVNANHSNYSLYIFAYDLDGIFVYRYAYKDVGNKRIRVNKSYQYRFMYVDDTSSEMPDYTNLSIVYDYSDDTVKGIENRVSALESVHQSTHRQRRPRITFIDDDGHIQFYTLIKPLMENYNIPYCVAYVATHLPYQPDTTHMSYAQCQEIVDLGGEILAHGMTPLTDMTLTEAETDVKEAKRILEEYGFEINGYVYPSGQSNEDVREMIAKHYKFAMKTNESQQTFRINTDCIPSYFINRCNNGGYYDSKTGNYANIDTASLNYMNMLVDECVEKNGWLIFVSHSGYMAEGSRREGYENVNQVQLLADTIEYIQSLKSSGTNIDIITASEGFEMFGNAYQVGDYLGYWNESNNYHNTPGCAVNKIGQWDFPTVQKITY